MRALGSATVNRSARRRRRATVPLTPPPHLPRQRDTTLRCRSSQRHGAWLHVDAIWGGALAYSADPTCRAYLRGLEHADSVAIGPQKWLFTPRLCALTLFPKLLDPEEFDAILA